MCNIAGYVGARRAAPILVEMLRRQEIYDGGLATGIATVHEGKIYMRKLPGNLDELIKETDALDLPGNIGIIHTRPGNSPASFTHPHLSKDGRVASVLNGTVSDDAFKDYRDRGATLAFNSGYDFVAKAYDCCLNFPTTPDGAHVPVAEVISNLISLFRSEGKSYSEAMKLGSENCFTDLVSVAVAEDDPDTIYAARVSRPMFALVGDGECFIASCEFAFPEEIVGARFSLPVLNVCEITKSGVRITSDRIGIEPVSEITPRSFALGMELVCDFLKKKRCTGGAYFDQIELFLKANQHLLFDGGYTYSQYARLVYDLIYRLDKEGLLKSEIRPSPKGNRLLRYMWLE